MRIIKTIGDMEILAGDGMAKGLYCARNKKTGKVSLWDTEPKFDLCDCMY